MANATVVKTIKLPPVFYNEEGRPSVDPNGEAVEYVTDGEQFGLRYEDSYIDWLGRTINQAFGDGAEIVG